MKKKAKKAVSQWKPIQLPKELVDDLETFANSKTAKSMGFTNKSQFAAYAVRAALDRHSDVAEPQHVTPDRARLF